MSDRALFNFQVFACFSFVAVCLARSLSSRRPNSNEPQISTRWSWIGLAGVLFLACAAYVPFLGDPLLSDDYILVHESSKPTDLIKSLTKPAGDGAMRPVGELWFGTFKRWAHEDAMRWHVASLSLHLLDISLLYLLCKRLSFSTYISLQACLLFALHPAHQEAVGWVSSTFDLLATGFSISVLIALTFNRLAAIWLAAPVLTALAILSKESAYAIPAIAVLIFAGRRTIAYPSAVVAAALFVHRWSVYGGPGGYLDAATGRPQIFNVTLLSVVKALFFRPWWTLLTPIEWAVRPSFALVGFLCLVYVGLVVIAMTSKVQRGTQVFLGATLLALIPPIHLALIGSDLQGSRVFYLPSAIFCIWFSAILGKRFVAAPVGIFCFFALRHNMEIRSEVAATARKACEAASLAVVKDSGKTEVRGLPRSLDGVFFFANGFRECVGAESGYPKGKQGVVLVWNPTTRSLTVQNH